MKNILIIGAGNMGEAMLRGWIKDRSTLNQFYVREPNPSEWLKEMDYKNKLSLNPLYIKCKIDVCVFAIKPQLADQVIIKTKKDLDKDCLVISVIAGKNFKFFASILNESLSVIRVMPNTPVSIEAGVSAIIGNKFCSSSQIEWADNFFSTLGRTVILEKESLINAITAISGSGPAYIFNLAEILIKSGRDLGLSEEISKTIVLQTIVGAGLLATKSEISPSKLRENVTSPNGTTEAALNILMNEKNGWHQIINSAINAAYERSKLLAKN